MTRQEIAQWIKRKLGAPSVSVELTDEQLVDCIDKAIRWFEARAGGIVKEASLTLVEGQNEYSVNNDVLDVIDVYFPGYRLFDYLPYAAAGFPLKFITTEFAGIVATQVRFESLKKIMGLEHAWEFLQASRKLRLYPTVGSGANGYQVIYKYLAKVSDLDELDASDLEPLMEYALAEAKEVLVAVRGKYRTVALPAGETELDADRLADEARTAKERLEEWAAGRGALMGIMVA